MNRTLKFAAASIFVLSLAGVANAQIDGKSYSPSFCTPVYNGAQFGNPSYANFPFRFENLSGTSMGVSCPIVKDNQDSKTGLNFAVIYVNNPSGSTTSCWIYSLEFDGRFVVPVVSAESRTAGLNALYLHPYPSKSGLWGTYSIMCTLPSGASIYSYTIYEN